MAVTQGIEAGRKRPAQDLGEAGEDRFCCFGGLVTWLVRIRHLFVGNPCVFLGFVTSIMRDAHELIQMCSWICSWFLNIGMYRDLCPEMIILAKHPNFWRLTLLAPFWSYVEDSDSQSPIQEVTKNIIYESGSNHASDTTEVDFPEWSPTWKPLPWHGELQCWLLGLVATWRWGSRTPLNSRLQLWAWG